MGTSHNREVVMASVSLAAAPRRAAVVRGRADEAKSATKGAENRNSTFQTVNHAGYTPWVCSRACTRKRNPPAKIIPARPKRPNAISALYRRSRRSEERRVGK